MLLRLPDRHQGPRPPQRVGEASFLRSALRQKQAAHQPSRRQEALLAGEIAIDPEGPQVQDVGTRGDILR